MHTILAYVLVVPLVQFCLTIGVLLGGFSVALVLAWTSVSVRAKAAGMCGGVAGVALAVAFGYGVFRLVVGPGAFTVGAFLASTIPLLVPIRNHFLQARRVETAREQLLSTLAPSTGRPATVMADLTQSAHGSGVIGELVGLVLAATWYFSK